MGDKKNRGSEYENYEGWKNKERRDLYRPPPSFVKQIHVDWHRYSLNTDLLNFLSSLECPNVYSKSWNFENIKSFAL